MKKGQIPKRYPSTDPSPSRISINMSESFMIIDDNQPKMDNKSELSSLKSEVLVAKSEISSKSRVLSTGSSKDRKYRIDRYGLWKDQDSTVLLPDRLNSKDEDTSKEGRKASELRVSRSYYLNKMLRDIRKNKTMTIPTQKGTKDKDWQTFMAWVDKTCLTVSKIFESEARVVKVSAPAHVFGDIHGSMGDILTIEKMLFPTGVPSYHAGNFLFLGDYVDRGEHSFEVCMYLFAMKIIAPEKFFLVRGNHEYRGVNSKYQLQEILSAKFPAKKVGEFVYKRLNEVFDRMPLAAVIDESIFCCHGGVPSSPSSSAPVKISEILKVPKVLANPMDNQIAWEILWNDPMNEQEFEERLQNPFHSDKKLTKRFMIDEKTGFTENTTRGTAKFFTNKATEAFLKANNLTHVIRAHEMVTDGYRLSHDGKLITVFSSRRYMGAENDSGYIFVENGRIIPFKILYQNPNLPPK